MNVVNRIFITMALLASLFSLPASGADKFDSPDFAFPAKVATESEKTLKSALKSHDNQAIVQSLINYSLARTSVNKDNVTQVLSKIDSVLNIVSEPTLSAMLNALEAKLLTEVYLADRYRYDQRILPPGDVPQDLFLWSGDVFKKVIAEKIDASLKNSAALKACNISEYANNIVWNNNPKVFYPTLFDFVSNIAIDLLKKLSSESIVLSQRYLAPARDYCHQPIIVNSKYVRQILSLYAELLSFHKDNIPALIHIDISRLNFVNRYVASEDGANIYISALEDLFKQYSDNEYSGEVILEISRVNDSTLGNKLLLGLIDGYLRRFPHYRGNKVLESIRENILGEEIRVSGPECVLPGVPAEFTVDIRNVNSGKLKIYNVTDIAEDKYNEVIKNSLPIAQLTVSCAESLPFTSSQKISYTFPDYGKYLILPALSDVKNYNYQVTYATSLALVSQSAHSDNSLLVLDRLTGKVVNDASVIFNERRFGVNGKETTSRILGHTSENGVYDFPAGDFKGGWIKVEKGVDRYAPGLYVSNYFRPQTEPQLQCEFYTSLPLYHQGDTIEWSAVVYSVLNSEHNLLPDKQATVRLYDVNRTLVDTITLTTDDFGRVEGKFEIPSDRLTGYYVLDMKVDGRHIGSQSVMISDYVAPTFKVSLQPVQTDFPGSGSACVRGSAATYSGFPIGNSKVILQLYSRRYFDFFARRSGTSYYTAETTTDDKGNFTFVIDKDVIEDAPIANGMFVAKVSVTSQSGESIENTVTFVMHKAYQISLKYGGLIAKAPDKLLVPVVVKDYNGDCVNIPLTYSIIHANDTLISNSPLPSDKLIPTQDLLSGSYKLLINSADKSLSSGIETTLVVYRASDSRPPVTGEVAWSPGQNNITVDRDRLLKWDVITDGSVVMHYTVASTEGIVDRGVFNTISGLNTWKYELPGEEENYTINIIAFKNGKVYTQSLTVGVKSSQGPLRIVADSFRDRISPSTTETWTFHVADSTSTRDEAAVMMRMYNASLDALIYSKWNFPKFSDNAWLNSNSNYGNIDFSYTSRVPSINYGGLNIFTIPSFNTWSQSLYSNNLIRIRGGKMLGSAKMAQTYIEAAPEQMLTMAAGAASDNGSDSYVVREHADEVIVAEDEPADMEYREAEVASGFFRPMLTTDAQGRLVVKFQVPNANATWRINAIAFTKAMRSAEFDASVIASKPVMVNPQLPAFVRHGDKVVVKSLVMNDTENEADITTEIEIINLADNTVVARSKETNTIGAKSSVSVDCEFNCNTSAEALYYKVRSYTPTFSDGEAGTIPVLPSVTPVIDSTPFYIPSGQSEASVALSSSDEKAVVTLQYTENPAWYVVSALPGLLTTDGSTSVQASASIFAAAVAEGILNDNPAIEKYLQEWIKSQKSDSTFVSMLQRNPDLKLLLLNATPWMLDAANDTERMSRLALLFDRKEIQNVFDKNITLLTTLVRDDNGLAWISSYEKSSDWATYNFLLLMGRLNSLGYLPHDSRLSEMIENALSYVEDGLAKTLERYPEATAYSFAMISGLFPSHTVSDKAAVGVANTLKDIKDTWKSVPVLQKAYDAIILSRNGKIAEAKDILVSVTEFAEYTPEKGMWFPSVSDSFGFWHVNELASTAEIMDIYAQILPQSPNVDKIRQWLILQKEATDWRQPVATSMVIASILRSSSKWLHPAGDVKFTIGGKNISTNNVENATGYFRVDISDKLDGNSPLVINRSQADMISWGSVMSFHESEMTVVKAHEIPDLSIEKKLYEYSGTEIKDIAHLTPGSKVRVQLTIVAGRDMDYVVVDDQRAACFTAVDQPPRPVYSQGICFYLETRSESSRIFIDRLPRGRYVLSYDVWVSNAGEYSSGVATIQSQYAPQLTAHSGGTMLSVSND